MIIQSLLFPDNNICSEEALYFHREESFICVDGYFNLFYLEKHHRYCNIQKLTLELSVRGIKAIYVMHDKELAQVVETCSDDGATVADDANCRLSITLPYEEYDRGVFWFKAQLDDAAHRDDLSSIGDSWSIKGHFEGYSDCCDHVELAVNICTYKREAYVTRNMKSLAVFMGTRDIDGGFSEASRHMHVFIVDNGKSLDDYEEFERLFNIMDDDKNRLINVIPNDNTGGAGGFGRGMREAIDRRDKLGLTHLLMMDDDAVFDPDLFVRLYGFLSLLRDEYKGITIGGALLREDYPYIQHASGEWFSNFKVINKHPLVDMRSFDNCTADWMTGTSDEKKMYGAWWCCCYNMDAITVENIPLPLFVHHDDIQFGMKQRDRGIVFLNGICVWHQGFELVFPGTKQYYNMRNTLITMGMFEPEVLKRRIRLFTVRRYIGLLISFRYGDCELVYRGYKDYLNGKGWLLSIDSEDLHKEISGIYKDYCSMKPLDELGLSSDEMDDVTAQIRGYKLWNEEGNEAAIRPDALRDYYDPERFNGPLYKKITFNGWLLTAKKGIKVITPLDSPWDAYRFRKILLYEPGTGKGALMMRSNRELFKGIGRVISFLVSFSKDFDW